jgi:hypothetical protein
MSGVGAAIPLVRDPTLSRLVALWHSGCVHVFKFPDATQPRSGGDFLLR